MENHEPLVDLVVVREDFNEVAVHIWSEEQLFDGIRTWLIIIVVVQRVDDGVDNRILGNTVSEGRDYELRNRHGFIVAH